MLFFPLFPINRISFNGKQPISAFAGLPCRNSGLINKPCTIDARVLGVPGSAALDRSIENACYLISRETATVPRALGRGVAARAEAFY